MLRKWVLKVRNEKYVEEIKRPGLISIKKLKCKAKVMEISKGKIQLIRRQLFYKKLMKYLSLTLTLKRSNDYIKPHRGHLYTRHRQKQDSESRISERGNLKSKDEIRMSYDGGQEEETSLYGVCSRAEEICTSYDKGKRRKQVHTKYGQ